MPRQLPRVLAVRPTMCGFSPCGTSNLGEIKVLAVKLLYDIYAYNGELTAVRSAPGYLLV